MEIGKTEVLQRPFQTDLHGKMSCTCKAALRNVFSYSYLMLEQHRRQVQLGLDQSRLFDRYGFDYLTIFILRK